LPMPASIFSKRRLQEPGRSPAFDRRVKFYIDIRRGQIHQTRMALGDKPMKPRKQVPLRSDIAWSTPDRIGVFGYDLPQQLIGRVNLGDMGFLEIVGRLPTKAESNVFNALLVTLVEHGVTPSAIATRMTYTGAPEAMQAAVAAGLLGLGTVFVGT